jgi:ABC-type lipoprotein release transport system permease subunit
LIVLFGYISTAVANSAGAAARLSMLRVIGTTPDQLRCIGRIEGLFLATVACVIGTVAAMPGLVSMTWCSAMER